MWCFIIVAIAQWIAILAVHANLETSLCRQPRSQCLSLSSRPDQCAEWSGCRYKGKRCVQNTTCDALMCETRYIALTLSPKILPSCVRGEQIKCDAELDRVSKALKLESDCQLDTPFSFTAQQQQEHTVIAKVTTYVDGRTIFVSPHGSDDNSGLNRYEPVATLKEALNKTRMLNVGHKTIVLMPGKHRLTSPIVLGDEDSGLSLQGETGAIVTAAALLQGVTWTRVRGDIWTARIPDELRDQLDTLAVLSFNGEPAIRARYPNVDHYTQSAFASPLDVSSWIEGSVKAKVIRSIRFQIQTYGLRYQLFVSTTGGSCTGLFEPPTGYFCDDKADADQTCPFSRIGSVVFNSNAAQTLQLSSWSQPNKAYFHTLNTFKWGGWSFRVNGDASSFGKNTLKLAEGGFQEARGDCQMGGQDWFVDNVPELLDSPNEFYFDSDTGTITFQLPKFATQTPNVAEMEIGTSLTRLFEIRGSSSLTPVIDISISNIQFERTSPTHMKPHEMPSGGDWSIHRTGTIFVENAEKIAISDCTFQKLGSHAIFLSNYARDVSIVRNNFYGLDMTAIAMVGDPKYDAPEPWDRRFDIDHIADVRITNNLISDIGIFGFQSAGIFGSIAKNIAAERNVIFNGPRAGIVYNDLFGNGLTTRDNIMFNLVNVTLDHGPYNVWDRQQWLVPPGFKDTYNIVDRNYIIGTAGGDKLVDLDDGSRAHVVTNNVMAYGYMKLKGANHSATNNIVVAYLPDQRNCVYLGTSHQSYAGFAWTSNQCFAPGSRYNKFPYVWSVGSRFLCKSWFVKTGNNAFYGNRRSFFLCGSTVKRWKRQKQDLGTAFDNAVQPLGIAAACRALMTSFAE